jgi:hypothetical protein
MSLDSPRRVLGPVDTNRSLAPSLFKKLDDPRPPLQQRSAVSPRQWAAATRAAAGEKRRLDDHDDEPPRVRHQSTRPDVAPADVRPAAHPPSRPSSALPSAAVQPALPADAHTVRPPVAAALADRQAAQTLLLRLRLSMYKVQTNQTTLPLAQLLIQPRAAAAAAAAARSPPTSPARCALSTPLVRRRDPDSPAPSSSVVKGRAADGLLQLMGAR